MAGEEMLRWSSFEVMGETHETSWGTSLCKSKVKVCLKDKIKILGWGKFDAHFNYYSEVSYGTHE